MKFTLASNAVALLTIAALATHAEANVAPLKVLGGKRVLADLEDVKRSGYATPDPFVGPVKLQARNVLEPRKWKNPPDETKKRCGPGVGSCDPGYW